jgi:hypothetical protein
MSALDIQIGGSHYRNKGIQPIELIVALNLNFIEGNIVKYITRYKEKNGVQDLMKCIHYSQLAIELKCIRHNIDIHNNYELILQYVKANDLCSVQTYVLNSCLQNDYEQVKLLCNEMIKNYNSEKSLNS